MNYLSSREVEAIPASEYNAYEAIRTAQIQADLCQDRARRDNARVSLEDALCLFNKGDWKYARIRAIDSLSYSVGKLSPIFQATVDRGPCR